MRTKYRFPSDFVVSLLLLDAACFILVNMASRCTHKHLRTPSCFEATSARDPRKMKLHGTCPLFRYCSNDSDVNEKLIDFLGNIAKPRSLKNQNSQALKAKRPQFGTRPHPSAFASAPTASVSRPMAALRCHGISLSAIW